MDRLSVGIVGCGRIAYLLEDDERRIKPATHLGAISHLSELYEVKAGCDIRKDRLIDFGKRFGVDNLYTDFRKLIDNEGIDLLIISLDTKWHFDVLEYAINNGSIKGVVLEKPVGIGLRKAKRLRESIRNSNVKVFVNHERRYHKDYRFVKEIIESGKLGKVSFARGVITGNPPKRVSMFDGTTPLFHDGTHLIDIMQYLLGDIDFVEANIVFNREPFYEKFVDAFLKFSSGVNGSITISSMHDYFHFEVELWFEKGKVSIGNGIKDYYISMDSPYYRGFKSLVKKEFPETEGDNYFIALYREVYDVLVGGYENITSSFEDGYKVLETIYAIYKSGIKKGERIYIYYEDAVVANF